MVDVAGDNNGLGMSKYLIMYLKLCSDSVHVLTACNSLLLSVVCIADWSCVMIIPRFDGTKTALGEGETLFTLPMVILEEKVRIEG